MNNVNRFETLWNTYIDKLARVEELQNLGRVGYQLRMPKKAVSIALEALRTEFPEESKGL